MNHTENARVPSRSSVPWKLRCMGLALLLAGTLAACQPAVQDTRARSDAGEPVPPKVPVAQVRAVAIDGGTTQLARVEAAQYVELQPRVSGPIEAVLFREGDLVRAGQPLFQIDPRPYDANLARARAELQLAKAREQLAEAEAARARKLHIDRAIAVEELERRAAAYAEAQARRGAAEAAVQTAQLKRDFTLVRSPIDARVGRALVTPGNFVAAGNNPSPLTNLVGTSPLHVHMDVADRVLISHLLETRGAKGWTVRIFTADGERELARAPVDFTNHSIDPGTGTLRLRARIDTPTAGLMPGQYVRARISTGVSQQALLVPDQAIGTDQGTRFVLVVKDAGQVEYRPVDVGAAQGSDRIITAGVEVGEQVVVAGLMRVRPGTVVEPVPSDQGGHALRGAAIASDRS